MTQHREIEEISFASSLDGAREHALWYRAAEGAQAPLVVGLHTWSYDRFNQLEHMLPLCRERGWNLLLPEFRGPNLKSNPRSTEACASELARQDVLDAIEKVRELGGFDAKALYLLGGSGGGHMALMLAAHRPELWSAVSSWVPITDLSAWHRENPNYAENIEACCGGAPGSAASVDLQYGLRSPLNYLAELSRVTLSVHHGRFDPVVSYRHTMNLVTGLERHEPKNFFFEIFDGGHDIRYDVAFRWFDGLRKNGKEQGSRLTG
ncbi:alpha/beta hydrolase family protein [Geomesophilobacter sediminis]|uniref:Prolyl oligopeptidase family serine peptidase n=1 Tax=Geomesophilobacter sediminis TaxID=2798584 RepID=A0A8J7IXA4_9BACT|nr:prolyl oligopeptidase family serine peptidase [Geomesophilobacter sediminis]MBJ6724457.1 prolyl oligopeptidase family serine peptidase [Geomesophilobacter sediminis]